MACALTAGYSQDCRDSMGGVKSLYIIEWANVTYTVASNVVTAVDNATSKRWWKYNPAKFTGMAKETINASVENNSVFYGQEITFPLGKQQTTTRNEILLLAQNKLAIVVEDQNGKFWLYGRNNGMDLTGGEAGTGTAAGDRNGYTLTFTGQEPALAIEMDTATAATLETPGS
jgi:hypothetical protein